MGFWTRSALGVALMLGGVAGLTAAYELTRETSIYLDPSVRGKGIGVALAAGVRDHLAPYGMRRILLATGDAHGVYEKVGFTAIDNPRQWMVLGEQ